jgi:hypothetical protein
MSRKGKKKPLPNNRRREGKAAAPAADARMARKEALGSIGRDDVPAARSFGSWDWLLAAALVVAVFLVYQPAWQGGYLWDDNLHLLENPVLQPGGLA